MSKTRVRGALNVRWLWLDHFPPGMELTPEERAAVRRLARQHRRQDSNYRGARGRTVRLLLGLIVPLTVVFILWTCWPFLFGRLFRSNTGVAVSGALSPVLFNGLLWMAITYAMYKTSAPYVRRALCDLGKPVCIDCGYIQAGLARTIARCPECGAERELMPPGAPGCQSSSPGAPPTRPGEP